MKDQTRFQFKKFSVDHGKASMRIGTDAIVLGAWTPVEKDLHILDIGTGSGVIALMLAQRTLANAHIDALDINPEIIEQATANFVRSPWNEKLKGHLCPLQDFSPKRKYDLIVSNPPYFQNGIIPSSTNRLYARHTHMLPLFVLALSVSRLLHPKGRFSIILPPVEADQLYKLILDKGFLCVKETLFKSFKDNPVERILRVYARAGKMPSSDELIQFEAPGLWSDDYKRLTQEFYLHL